MRKHPKSLSELSYGYCLACLGLLCLETRRLGEEPHSYQGSLTLITRRGGTTGTQWGQGGRLWNPGDPLDIP